MANFLYYEEYSKVVKLQGYYKTIQNKIHKSETIELKIDKYIKL